jgi:hypothetical protein
VGRPLHIDDEPVPQERLADDEGALTIGIDDGLQVLVPPRVTHGVRRSSSL